MTQTIELNAAEAELRAAVENTANPPYAALETVMEALEDARLWRALMQTARFRIQGSAGLNSDGTIDPNSGRDYIHFGMEVWSAYRILPEQVEAAEQSNTLARAMLRSLAEMNMRGASDAVAEAARVRDEDSLMYGRAVMLGLEVRQVIRLMPEVGLAKAIEQSSRPMMSYDRTLKYLQMKGLVIADPLTPEGVRLSRVGEEMRTYLRDRFDETEFAEAEAAALARSAD